jgi:hypothetical protein
MVERTQHTPYLPARGRYAVTVDPITINESEA